MGFAPTPAHGNACATPGVVATTESGAKAMAVAAAIPNAFISWPFGNRTGWGSRDHLEWCGRVAAALPLPTKCCTVCRFVMGFSAACLDFHFWARLLYQPCAK